MRRHGYYFCEVCEEMTSGPRCERNNSHPVKLQDVPLHHNPFRHGIESQPKPVSVERGAELWRKLHEQLKF